MKLNSKFSALGVVLIVAILTLPAFGQDVPPPKEGERTYSPYPEKSFPNRVYFGDTHLHTSYSTDAGMLGNTLGPDEAYRFARGEEVIQSHGLRAQLQRPLDFLVIADHAANLGLAPMIAESNPALLANEWGKKVYDLVMAGRGPEAYNEWLVAVNARKNPMPNEAIMRTMWQRLTASADKYNDPGQFTAFIGYEWTSIPNGNNLHRVLVFRDNSEKANQIIPFSQYESVDPEDLWNWMASYEQNTGGRVFAAAHNGNLSNGLMFDDITLTTKVPLDRDYAERRMRWEPLYEVTQMKGDGEAHPILSADDEFADFETWDRGSFGPQPKNDDMIRREYAREALKRGLAYEEQLGVNPFKFGMIGSTDSHTSLATTQEDNFFGKVEPLAPSDEPDRMYEVLTGRLPSTDGSDIRQYAWQTSASGLAAVWSRENTREALWDAMSRKEVYATSGTRLQVRVFAGWDFEAEDLYRSNFAENGYEHGVPMGGDLSSAPRGKAPTLLVRAVRDGDGANLDRIQIIKGWLDGDGETHERIYDVAVSDGRAIGRDGRTETPVGNTVNVEEASYTNAIGDPFLTAYWQDPDFDADQRAFYYVRVIEIPTPRWTTYDANIFGVDIPEGAPTSIQDRAYTSPIWYTPGN
ncbi:MAG: DUF3604 domain-containing protein [Bacteroidetes bacterium]|nr:MAG: DUF3604 domain-containing protein [Bacteroidota bacterium]